MQRYRTQNQVGLATNHKWPKFKDCEGWRSLAFCFFHLWGKTTFKEGYLGVDIFFVISGYLMCHLLTRETQLTVERVTDFYYRRAKRIVPIYLLVIWLVLMAAVFYFIYPIDYLLLVDQSLKPLLFVENLPDSTADDYFIQSMGAYRFLKHCWSLSVEIQFYLLVPALIWLLNLFAPSNRIVIISFFGFASFWKQVHSTANDEHMSLAGRIWQFMFGFQNYDLHSIGSKIFHVAVTYILIASLWFKLTHKKHVNRLILLTVTTLIISRPRGNWLLGQWWLVWLGDASYSIYLVHYPLFEWHRYEFIRMYQFNEQTNFIAGAVLIAVSIVLGYAIERSYHSLSRWINSWTRLLLVITAGYLCIGATLFYLIKASVPQTEGTGDKNIVVFGNSHARSYYFGIEYAFRGLYKNMAMFGTNCPLNIKAERDFEGGYKNSYNRCTTFRKNAFKMLRKWNYKIDVIIVAVNYHRFVSYPLAANLTEDVALQEMNSIYREFSSLAREVVFMPQIHFVTGIDPHSATLQRQILYDRSLDAFQTTIKSQTKILTSGRNRLEMVDCPKCILVDWLKVWCDEETQKCDSIDQHHRLSYFFDSHHVNALGSLKVGAHLRELYDHWRNKQKHFDYNVYSQ
ncbi:Acyl-transf-3 domain-containing protein [Aphelenchoides besseyi]|nr:Acyl-transf-3 domain-containing protein [Aphelenchoides besseyi]